jgi:hypothetical protein
LTGAKVVIRRTTADGRFTLDQTWTRDVKERDLKVLNVLTANVASTAVSFIRYADISADGDALDDAHDYSQSTAWIRDVRAVTLTDMSFGGGTVVVGNFSADCSITVLPRPQPGGGIVDDKYAVSRFTIGNMAAGNKRTFTLTFRVQ